MESVRVAHYLQIHLQHHQVFHAFLFGNDVLHWVFVVEGKPDEASRFRETWSEFITELISCAIRRDADMRPFSWIEGRLAISVK